MAPPGTVTPLAFMQSMMGPRLGPGVGATEGDGVGPVLTGGVVVNVVLG